MSIEKVAKLAGVSNSTVSRVINDNPSVSPETLKAVRAAMETLQYTPSARRPGPKPSQRNGTTTRSLAFLALGITEAGVTPAFEKLLRGVSAAASDLNATLSFIHLRGPANLPATIRDLNINGLLLHGAVPPDDSQLRRLPCVWLMGNRRRPEFGDQVMPDTYEIGAMSARHLLARGHRRLAYLNLDAGHWSFTLTRHAFEETARAAGATVTAVEMPRVESSDYQSHHTVAAANELLDRLFADVSHPTGLMIADDMQTAILQPLLQRRGVTLGKGHSEIVSVNNEQPYLIGLDPRPAVLDLRFAEVGSRGVEQLLWRIDHQDVKERMITAISPTLIVD